MVKKILAALFFVMLFSQAMATLSVTWNLPATGTSYNNTPGNLQTIDLNYTVADTNTNPRDVNFGIVYFPASGTAQANAVTILADTNAGLAIANQTSARTCIGADLSGYTCNIRWAMPNNSNMGDGAYFVDVNVFTYLNGGSQNVTEDVNARISITINTKLATAQTTRDLMAIVGVVLAAIVLIGGLSSIAILKTDPAKTAIATVVAAVAVAIAAMIIGQVLSGL